MGPTTAHRPPSPSSPWKTVSVAGSTGSWPYPILMFAARPNFGIEEPVFFSVGQVTEERTTGLGSETIPALGGRGATDRPTSRLIRPATPDLLMADPKGSRHDTWGRGQRLADPLVRLRRVRWHMIPAPTPAYLDQLRHTHEGHIRVTLFSAGVEIGELPIETVRLTIDGRAEIWRTAEIVVGIDYWETETRDWLEQANVQIGEVTIEHGIKWAPADTVALGPDRPPTDRLAQHEPVGGGPEHHRPRPGPAALRTPAPHHPAPQQALRHPDPRPCSRRPCPVNRSPSPPGSPPPSNRPRARASAWAPTGSLR